MKEMICPNCQGKGHVFDIVSIIGTLGFGLLLAPFERNDTQGLTRTRCEKCKGIGIVKGPDDK